MKTNLLNNIAFGLGLLCVLGFGSCKTTAIDKQKKAEEKIIKAEKAIVKKGTEIEDKGKAFVYGANYANRQETNRTTAIDISGRFLDLASLTLGSPNLKDSSIVKGIVDDLLAKAKVDVALANAAAAQSDIEKKKFQKEAEYFQKQVLEGERKLQLLEKIVVQLQGQEGLLKVEYEKKLGDAMELAQDNAEKATKYDEEHTFLNAINPFKDIWNGVKKLLGWGVFIGAVTILFSVLETVFPQLRIAGVFFGWFGKIAMKLFPSAKKAAGVVAENVWSGFKNITVAIQHSIDTLRDKPIEDKVLEFVPDDAKLNKIEIKRLLELHTENVIQLIESELKEHHDAESHTLVQYAKAETGIKPMMKKVDI